MIDKNEKKEIDYSFKPPEMGKAEPKRSPHVLMLAILILLIVGIAGAVSAKYYKNYKNNKHEEDAPPAIVDPVAQPKNFSSLANATDYFNFNLLKQIDAKGKNTFISPLSISMILSLTANGAKGTTEKEMWQVLGFDKYSVEEINAFNKKLITDLKSDDNKEISLANSIWVDQSLPLLTSFSNIATNEYSAETKNVNFKDKKSAKTINDWVMGKTNNKIKDLVDADMIKDLKLALVNAIYFKASWLNPFSEGATATGNFTLETGEIIEQDLMSDTSNFDYYENEQFQMIKLPYKDKNLEMDVILPSKSSTVDDFVENLSWDEFNGSLEKMENKRGFFKMPKFKIEYERDIKDDLETLGMKAAMDCSDGSAVDFTGISEEMKLCIGLVKHKSFVEVSEKGTEAAAATVVGMQMAISNKPEVENDFEMIVDRPFFFVIRDNKNEVNLFSGIIKDPRE